MEAGIIRMGKIWGLLLLFFTLFFPWTLDIRKVEGRSMEPAYHPGRIVVSWRWSYGIPRPFSSGYLLRWSRPDVGDVVVFRAPPGDHYALKRVHSVTYSPSDKVELLGDNTAVSRDSRDFGLLPVDDILGKVLF